MKKQLLAIAVLTAGIASAQTFSENFSSTTAPGLPATWLQNNVDGNTVAASATFSFGTNAWVSRNYSASTDPATAAHGKLVVSTSWYTPAGIANDWLITPSFVVPANGVLAWDAIATDAGFPDGYVVAISTTGTTTASFTNTLLTVAAENPTWNSRAISLNTYAGQTVRIAFVNNSNDMNVLLLDNISCIVPAANDLKITSIAPTGQAVWGANGSTKSITGTVVNNGLSTITSFTARYSDGTVNANSVITGLNLAYGQSAPFTITTPYTIASASAKALKVWVDETGDVLHTNDTLNTTINGYSFVPTHKIVFEEGTGTWCGWCVRGAVYMDSMNHVNPTTTALIAVHNGDPMVDATYDTGMGALISGYPTALHDRVMTDALTDPSEMYTAYADHIGDFALASLSINPTYNTTTRVATINVSTMLASSMANNTASSDYRLAVAFTEDNVRGTTTAYDQHNYYQGGGSGVMTGAGHHFSTEPNPVVAANMKYDFVARTIVGGFKGLANSLPNSLVAGTTYTNTFTYTIPAAYNAGNMKAIALLIDAKNNIIYNAQTTTITPSTSGINTFEAAKTEVAVYPNPAKNFATLEVNLTKSETITVNVLSVMGQVVYTQTFVNVPAGTQTIALNSENWSNGIYNVNVSTSNGSVSRKLEIIK